MHTTAHFMLLNPVWKTADSAVVDIARNKKGGSGFFTLFLCVQWLCGTVFSIGHTGQ